MSILIKGLKIPNACDECWALDESGDYPMCRITGETRGYTFRAREKRMGRCPLVELPTADELAEDMRTAAKDKDKEISHRAMDDIMCRLLCEMGYEEAVAIFDDKPKWYA